MNLSNSHLPGVMKIRRIETLPRDSRQGNILPQYALEHAAWLWHPQNPSAVEFQLACEFSEQTEFDFQISADNRFELYIDGRYAAMGPDRSDLKHWSFATYRLELEKGTHTFTARCIYLCDQEFTVQPLTQVMYKPGFVFAATDERQTRKINTGCAPWRVRKIAGITASEGNWAVGAKMTYHLEEFFAPEEWCAPSVVELPLEGNSVGHLRKGWQLYPTRLPEQLRKPFEGKIEVRAVSRDIRPEGIFFSEEACHSEKCSQWQKFFSGKEPLVIPAEERMVVLLDFRTYLCAYPLLNVEGGKDASVKFIWKEALNEKTPLPNSMFKGNRDEVAGKWCVTEHQVVTFDCLDGKNRKISPFWWNAGRYVALDIRTAESPLMLCGLSFVECRYPLENESSFALNNETDALQTMMLRALQCCSHETLMDCPFYEQLMYVGDSRLELLVLYTMTGDGALPLRTLELFSWSQQEWSQLISERYPSRLPQLSATFSMIFPLAVRDFMMYRRFPSVGCFQRLRNSVRGLLMALSEYLNSDGLLENLPGWSFVDWVNSWHDGVPVPGRKESLHCHESQGCFSILTLQFMLALKAAVALEEFQTDVISPGLIQGYEELCDRCRTAVRKVFWNSETGLIADFPDKETYSRHAQSLAILSEVIEPQEIPKMMNAIQQDKTIEPCTQYFIFYLFEAFCKCACPEKILEYQEAWSIMQQMGAVTCWEKPDPARSDCHAWGAHLYYHYFATLAGIRPKTPEFREVVINPAEGMPHLAGKMPHPDGWIVFDLLQERNMLSGVIALPEKVTGELNWQKGVFPLHGGINRI